MAENRDIFRRDPYVQVLPEGVIEQMLITIQGAPKKGVERFDINICKGADVAFQFNPRFNENGRQAIVRTTRIDAFWGSEERHFPFFPFRHEQPFEIKILCTASGYRVKTDTNLELHYAHRICQLKEMTHILIVGVDLKNVHVGDIFRRDPCVQVLPEGVIEQMLITIQGAPKKGVERFDINICKGFDVAFQFNPRFNENGRQAIVRTTRTDGIWGSEERDFPFFPFRHEQPFEIKILCTASGYRVKTDTNLELHYAHRICQLKEMTHILIVGVDLKNVHVENAVLKTTHPGIFGNPALGDIFRRDPYVQVLPEGVIEQMLITIQGAPKKGVERFDINICKGADVAFQFNPRFNENGRQAIVRTTRIDAFWGSEERDFPFFPFRHEQPFEIKILCTASGYRVKTDTNLELHYAHRICQLKEMTHILIVGVDLKNVHVEGYFLRVPYIQVLPEGLKDQSLITIYGAPKENADRFSFNICKGKDVAFHFSPRFNEHGRQLIVMASLIRNRWCPRVEEYSLFPFRRGKPFEIKIFCTSSGYRVEVDKVHVLHYIHSFWEMDQITHFHIHRDVVLKHVHIDV